MVKTYLYIPEDLEKEINDLVKQTKKSKAEILRKAIKDGIDRVKQQTNASAMVLLKIAEMGEKYNLKGPKDSSKNMDKYLWDKDWSKEK